MYTYPNDDSDFIVGASVNEERINLSKIGARKEKVSENVTITLYEYIA